MVEDRRDWEEAGEECSGGIICPITYIESSTFHSDKYAILGNVLYGMTNKQWVTGELVSEMTDSHLLNLHRYLVHHITKQKTDLLNSLHTAKDIKVLEKEIERRGLEQYGIKYGEEKERAKLW